MCYKAEKHIKHIAAGSTKLAPSDYTKTQKGGWPQPLDDTWTKAFGHIKWIHFSRILNDTSWKESKVGGLSGGGNGRCFGSVECRVRQTDASLKAFDTGDYY